MPTGARLNHPPHRSQQDVEALVINLQRVLRDIQYYKHLLGCNESDAQNVLDVFQWLLDMPQLDAGFRRSLIVAAQRLSTKSGLYPVCYELKGVIQLTEHPVACGGFADIYKGEFQGQIVCIKAIRVYETSEVEHLLKQFSKEAILWGQLTHLNVLPVYGLYRFRNQLCLVAPWMGNSDINKYLKQKPKAPRRRLASDIANGLQYLHDNGVIHGDLKGPNILINDDGRACVADFGISSISDPEILAWTSHSSAGSKGGSVRWQAPELFDMENDELVKNSVASDVYAWACVCFEIFTGTVPFANIPRDPAIILQVKLGNRPARPTPSSPAWQEWGLTEPIWCLMQDCWRENPADRPTIEEVISRLRPELDQDERPSRSVLSPARFRERVAEPLDSTSMTTLDRLLAVAMNTVDTTDRGSISPVSSQLGEVQPVQDRQRLPVHYESSSFLTSYQQPSPPPLPPPASIRPEVAIARSMDRNPPIRVLPRWLRDQEIPVPNWLAQYEEGDDHASDWSTDEEWEPEPYPDLKSTPLSRKPKVIHVRQSSDAPPPPDRPSSPRTTRRLMMQNEMTDSLAQDLLWEWEVNKGFRARSVSGGTTGSRGDEQGRGRERGELRELARRNDYHHS